MAVKVYTEPMQAFSAGFALYGTPQRGLMILTSPIGTTLARMQWQPDGATLDSGNGVRSYASLEAMASEVTGTDLPIASLFEWLEGRNQKVAGWEVNVDGLAKGVLTARRTGELPQAEVRLVLDR